MECQVGITNTPYYRDLRHAPGAREGGHGSCARGEGGIWERKIGRLEGGGEKRGCGLKERVGAHS
eukprot:647919-Rhodomonas_salina.2